MKKILILFIINITFLFSANHIGFKCINNYKNSVERLTILPSIILKNNSFKILFQKTNFDHPKNFLIRDPNGKSFFLVDNDLRGASMKVKDFLRCWYFIVDTSRLKGITWNKKGKQIKKLIFNKKGIYTLYFADNLETESTNTYSLSRKVEYKW